MAMKAKQVKDLWEAYSKVYQNLDEVKSSESSAADYLKKDKKIPPGTKVQVKPMEEEVDVYDLIRSYLIDEGYAETPEAAFAIMANMSEEWRQSIVEGSASMSANVPSGRTVKMTASGKEPAGDALVRRAGEAISGFLGSRGKVQSTIAQPRKPLVSTSKPGPSNNFGRGF